MSEKTNTISFFVVTNCIIGHAVAHPRIARHHRTSNRFSARSEMLLDGMEKKVHGIWHKISDITKYKSLSIFDGTHPILNPKKRREKSYLSFFKDLSASSAP